MALTTVKATNYYNLGWNMFAGTPKAGYTPVKGHLVFRTNNQADEWDLCVNGSTPEGLVESTNNSNGTITVARLVPGTTLILDQDGTAVLGNAVQTTAVAVGSLTGRTQVKNGAGAGKVRALNPAGTNTVEVEF